MSNFTAIQADEVLTSVQSYIEAQFPEFKSKMSVKRYLTSGQVSFKMEMTQAAVADEVNGKQIKQLFIKQGVNAGALGFEFKSQGKNFQVIDCKAWKQKYPVICRREDGKMIRFTAQTINSEIRNAKDA